MIRIRGKYNEAVVFTDTLEPIAEKQIETLCDQPFTEGSSIRIMPDVHAGAGCTIGTTMTIEDKAVPNLVGVDIGCGMETVRLAEEDVSPEALDRAIRKRIPAGFAVRKKPHEYEEHMDWNELRCLEGGRKNKAFKLDRARLSMGTLGGGNHFIELNRDEEGRLYLVVHSGSRNIGLQVAQHYQRLAAAAQPSLPRDLAYLEGDALADYLHDMQLMQRFADWNRQAMVDEIVRALGLTVEERITTIHNYIDLPTRMLRKGAVSAQKGEKLLIPMNMRDGSLLCEGLGNPEWNESAPHGAGRLMSRNEARRTLSVEALQAMMHGVYTTSLGRDTLDESPQAYKPMEEIVRQIGDTVLLRHRLKPLYNFKSGEG